MDSLLVGFVFFFGASIGSFYVTLAHRILRFFYGKQRKGIGFWEKWWIILTHPSSCPSCKTRVSLKGLIPFLGYYLVGRSCENCGSKIPKAYPFVEGLYGVLAVVLYLLSQNFYSSIFLCLFLGHLIIAIATDFNHFSLDYENIPFLLLWGVLYLYFRDSSLPSREHYYTFFAFLGFFLLLFWMSKGGVGFGDVLYAPVFAFLAGNPWWMFYLNASYILALVGTFLFRDKSKPLKGTKIPMGVYFSISIFLTFFVEIIFEKTGGFHGESF